MGLVGIGWGIGWLLARRVGSFDWVGRMVDVIDLFGYSGCSRGLIGSPVWLGLADFRVVDGLID